MAEAVEGQVRGSDREVQGRPLGLGQWSAWAVFAFDVVYLALVGASGAFSGAPRDPFWAAAEAVTVIGAPIHVVLFAVIFQLTPAPARVFGVLAFGFMLSTAAVTSTVHLIELLVARRVAPVGDPALGYIYDFTQPSLFFAADVTAWHFLFGLSLLFAAVAFTGPGSPLYVRAAFLMAGLLCLLGLTGPAFGNPYLRLIGVFGYGAVFPILCLLLGVHFRSARKKIFR
ncbi:hypothetical protein [Arthrobacter sp. FW306-06-A]|uniref:hypothetical protein n=1 Tax=Arthrobacter sp. FW306-06-A TaxID=2879621 RepID=UPI001F2A9D54|nr:hypothetical protein [Arthrobacter sp. FW306-06-A]UKA71898.1 hypothetical protein LFT49_03910 [Arthrobacter sp. FW306-06-A]